MEKNGFNVCWSDKWAGTRGLCPGTCPAPILRAGWFSNTAVLVYLEFNSNSRGVSCLSPSLRPRGPSVCCRDLWSHWGLRNQDPSSPPLPVAHALPRLIYISHQGLCLASNSVWSPLLFLNSSSLLIPLRCLRMAKEGLFCCCLKKKGN